MDSSAYLTRHGWRGEGHALHPTGRGIKKPLLVSKKTNVLGIGKKKNDIHADQWWARAFDKGLKSLDVSKSTKSEAEPVRTNAGARGALELLQSGGGKWAGLYSGFVKGQGLDGTLGSEKGPGLNVATTATSLNEQLFAGTLQQTIGREHDHSLLVATETGCSIIDQEGLTTGEAVKVIRKLERDERRRLRQARRLARQLKREAKEIRRSQAPLNEE